MWARANGVSVRAGGRRPPRGRIPRCTSTSLVHALQWSIPRSANVR